MSTWEELASVHKLQTPGTVSLSLGLVLTIFTCFEMHLYKTQPEHKYSLPSSWYASPLSLLCSWLAVYKSLGSVPSWRSPKYLIEPDLGPHKQQEGTYVLLPAWHTACAQKENIFPGKYFYYQYSLFVCTTYQLPPFLDNLLLSNFHFYKSRNAKNFTCYRFTNASIWVHFLKCHPALSCVFSTDWLAGVFPAI